MIKNIGSSAVLAIVAAASFALGLWSLVRLEPAAQSGGDTNVHIDITPLSVGLFLAGIALGFLRIILRRRASMRAASQTEPS